MDNMQSGNRLPLGGELAWGHPGGFRHAIQLLMQAVLCDFGIQVASKENSTVKGGGEVPVFASAQASQLPVYARAYLEHSLTGDPVVGPDQISRRKG